MKLYFIFCLLIPGILQVLPQSSSSVSQKNTVSLTSSNLPIIIIKASSPIPDEPKIEADMGIIYNGEGIRNNIGDPFNNFSGKIGIEVRGSSSQQFPKKQYGIEVMNSAGDDSSVSLLGLPEESDWVLFGPYNDKSLIRDALMYKLANSLGHYASRSVYFELVRNDDYQGIYVLFEKIKRDKNRVNIAKLEPSDTVGIDLTGGYIIKIDKLEGSDRRGWTSPFPPYKGAWQGVFYQYDTPDPDEIVRKQENYIKTFMNEFESVMNVSYYADSLTGYEKYIDVHSFIDFFLLNEFSRNVDGFRLSSYMYKEKDKETEPGKLIMGPVWDFNLAFGNANYYEAWDTEGFQLFQMLNSEHGDNFMPPFWWPKLYADPRFKNRLIQRWNELRKNELSNETIYAYIDSLVSLLDEARTRNFQKWPVLDRWFWPNYFVGQNYEQEIEYLKEWIRDRGAWLDSEFKDDTGTGNTGEEHPTGFVLHQNYPNPFNAITNFRFRIPSSSGGELVSLKVFDVLGNEIIILVNEERSPGEYILNFDASNFSSGVYYYQLKTRDLVSTKKMVLLK